MKPIAAEVVQSPDLKREDLKPQTTESSAAAENLQESIARLAHALWEARGCPLGSSEYDWAEAEKQILMPQASMVAAAGR